MKSITKLVPGELFEIRGSSAYNLRREPSIYVEFEEEYFFGPLLFIGESVTPDEGLIKDSVKFLFVIPRWPAIPGWLTVSKFWTVDVL